MTSLVIDASVGAKWFLPAAGESLNQEAASLLNQYAEGKMRFLVPDLYWAELANIFWKAARQKRWSSVDAMKALHLAQQANFPTFASRTLLEDAFAISDAFNCSVYDSLYVALAVLNKSQLVTADEKLANALAAVLPVRWLGAFV